MRAMCMMEVFMMIGYRRAIPLSILVLMIGMTGCPRDNPAEQAQSSPPRSAVDQAVRQSVDTIQTPMGKARGVEETLQDAASRTADRALEGTQ